MYPIYLALLALYALFLPWDDLSKRKKTTIASPFLILLILPVFTGGWWKYLVPYAPLLTILASGGLVLGVDKLFHGSKLIKTYVISFFTILIMVYYVDRYNGLLTTLMTWKVKPVPAANSIMDKNANLKRMLPEEARKAGQWAAAHYGTGKNYMVEWNKLIYHLDGLWTALPIAEPEKVYLYALRNQVDILVIEGIDPEIPDSALNNRLYGFSLDSVYHSEKTPYRVAFFRPIRTSDR